ncbi:GMC oxidoreductase-domain-containing protein [Hypoxylon argillaceum]|nr:GMC oxidoreductase-domain-containing protein [Hypoxylon argillaceum]
MACFTTMCHLPMLWLFLAFTACLSQPTRQDTRSSKQYRQCKATSMALHTELPVHLQEVDVIITGGGTSGNVLASRLSDAYPDMSILVIEGGPDNANNPNVTIPSLFRFNLAPGSTTSTAVVGQPEGQLAGRAIPVLSGAVLGGGSSVNALAYARGQASDFDAWNTKGWSADELLPFLKKLETFYGEDDLGTHGHSGPIEASFGKYVSEPLMDDFVTAVNETGYNRISDVHNLFAINAVAPDFRYASPKDGKRQDTAHKYLHPRLHDNKHPNLNVLVGAQVNKVLFSDGPVKEATGIEYRLNPKFQTANESDRSGVYSIKARKLVVVSAGVFGTPLILERSGLGDKKVLDAAGIKVTHELPGVGREYHDHQAMSFVYKSKVAPADTVDSLFTGLKNLTDLIQNDDPILSWTGIDAMAKVRPNPTELSEFRDQYRAIWEHEFANVPTKPLFLLALINGLLADVDLLSPQAAYFTISPFLVHAKSRGYVHITGPGIDDPVDFRTGFVSDPDDFDVLSHVWVYKRQREAARRMKFYNGEVASKHPPFPEGSGASLATPLGQDLTYSAADDELIKTFVRERVGTISHGLGTCRMAPEQEMGVVDASLNVYGTERLKVADMSIAPGNVSGNTMNTAVLIGEKAADLIIKELGSKK